jgi:hypothetical protein
MIFLRRIFYNSMGFVGLLAGLDTAITLWLGLRCGGRLIHHNDLHLNLCQSTRKNLSR